MVPGDYEERKKAWLYEHRYRATNKHGKLVWKKPPMLWRDYDGPRTPVQKVNRVYASIHPDMGTLVKVKPDGTMGKIQNLPDSCVIDNRNQLTLSDVDRSWYITLAKKYIKDYVGDES